MTARYSDNYDFLTLTKARLNPPFFILSDTVFAVLFKNKGALPIYLQNITVTCKGFVEGSAVMYFQGDRMPLKAVATEEGLTLKSIYIPPRERVIVFYRTRVEE